jgi:Cdc6-like AAA superfamily ATPase
MAELNLGMEGSGTPEDWIQLEFEARLLFTPSTPVDERDLFAGREDERMQLLEAVAERGRHAVVYGERGVGKTSLAKVFYLWLSSATRRVHKIRVQCDPTDDFTSIWRKVFAEMGVEATREGQNEVVSLSEFYADRILPNDVKRELSRFSPNDVPIIVIDEFDKSRDLRVAELMANTIKSLSDDGVNVTVIIIGVSESVDDLIGEHESIKRCISQIRMPRMSNPELYELLDKRLPRLRMKITEDAKSTIVVLSRGLPAYAHALAQFSATNAIREHRLIIREHHVERAIADLLNQTDQSCKSDYQVAIHSNQRENLYRHVLLACALAKADDEGYFLPVAVCDPLSKILGKRVEIATFKQHLNKFAGVDRGGVLVRKGKERAFRFRFSDPMMQPYVIMSGIRDGLVNESARSILAFPRQLRLSSEF